MAAATQKKSTLKNHKNYPFAGLADRLVVAGVTLTQPPVANQMAAWLASKK